MVTYEQKRCVDMNGLERDGVGLTQKLDLLLKCRGFRVQVSQVETDAVISGFRFVRVVQSSCSSGRWCNGRRQQRIL